MAPRTLLSLLAVTVLLAACTPATAPTTTTTAVAVTSSTVPPSTTTTTRPPPTTTLAPPRTATVVGEDLPDGLAATLTLLASWLADARNPAPPLAGEGGAALAGAAPDLPDRIAATATAQDLPDGRRVAVAHLGGDLVLAADEGDGWVVAGVDLGDRAPWFGPEPGMVLVLGSDARPGQDPPLLHADSIHVVTAVPSLGRGTILGWPRDSYVPTPYGDMRITALMAGRGPEVVRDYFREHWELPVEGYVLTGFDGFQRLVGELGSIVIDLPRSIPHQKYWPGFRSGEQRLGPERTLDLARTRKKIPGGDLTRSLHQGMILLAALRVVQSRSIDDAPGEVAALLAWTWTDLSATRLIQLTAAAYRIDPDAVTNLVLPGRLGRSPSRASVVFLEPEAETIIADLRDDGLLAGG